MSDEDNNNTIQADVENNEVNPSASESDMVQQEGGGSRNILTDILENQDVMEVSSVFTTDDFKELSGLFKDDSTASNAYITDKANNIRKSKEFLQKQGVNSAEYKKLVDKIIEDVKESDKDVNTFDIKERVTDFTNFKFLFNKVLKEPKQEQGKDTSVDKEKNIKPGRVKDNAFLPTLSNERMGNVDNRKKGFDDIYKQEQENKGLSPEEKHLYGNELFLDEGSGSLDSKGKLSYSTIEKKAGESEIVFGERVSHFFGLHQKRTGRDYEADMKKNFYISPDENTNMRAFNNMMNGQAFYALNKVRNNLHHNKN